MDKTETTPDREFFNQLEVIEIDESQDKITMIDRGSVIREKLNCDPNGSTARHYCLHKKQCLTTVQIFLSGYFSFFQPYYVTDSLSFIKTKDPSFFD